MLNDPLLADSAPWRQRFKADYIFYSYIAPQMPDKGIILGKIKSPTIQLFAWDVATGKLRQLTDEAKGINYGWLTPSASHFLYLQDKDGSEFGHLVRFPYEGGEAENITPTLDPFTLRGMYICRSGRRLAFTAVNDNGYQLYTLDFTPDGKTTPPQRIYQTQDETWESIISYDGELIAAKSSARAKGKRNYSILIFNAKGEQIAELWDGDEHSTQPFAFSPVANDFRLLATTTRSGFTRPLIWHPQTNERHDIELPNMLGDVMPLDWSPDGTQLLLSHILHTKTTLHLYDLASQKLVPLAHPLGIYQGAPPFTGRSSATYFHPTGDILAQWSDGSTPPQLILLDKKSGAQKTAVLNISQMPTGQPKRSITFPSSDGTEIQGWLCTPEGDGPFPTILNIHGGPHMSASGSFDPYSQIWVDHGFAFFSINYRGSTGFGHQFQHQIVKNVGHWEVEDIVAAREWLVSSGVAKADSIILAGASYGGYLTTLTLAKYNTLWAGGITFVSIVDWALNYEDCSEAIRGLARSLFGGTPDELPEAYKTRSPSHYVDQIQAPLLVHQAKNDSRAAPRQMEQFAAKMEALGKPLEIVWYDDGHGGFNTDFFMTHLSNELRFAYKILGKLE